MRAQAVEGARTAKAAEMRREFLVMQRVWAGWRVLRRGSWCMMSWWASRKGAGWPRQERGKKPAVRNGPLRAGGGGGLSRRRGGPGVREYRDICEPGGPGRRPEDWAWHVPVPIFRGSFR